MPLPIPTSLLALALITAPLGAAAPQQELRFNDVRRQTVEFMGYNGAIKLTPAQQAIFDEALEALPAPCCKDNSARTCCCTCNAARTWWGLTKHLIADLGYDADQVTAKVAEWFETVNPGGYRGDACYSGGCGRPFRQDGCAGMQPSSLVF